MDRYTKVDQIIKNAHPNSLRECPSKGSCACRGCFALLGISKSDYEKSLQRRATLDQYFSTEQGKQKIKELRNHLNNHLVSKISTP